MKNLVGEVERLIQELREACDIVDIDAERALDIVTENLRFMEDNLTILEKHYKDYIGMQPLAMNLFLQLVGHEWEV